MMHKYNMSAINRVVTQKEQNCHFDHQFVVFVADE